MFTDRLADLQRKMKEIVHLDIKLFFMKDQTNKAIL